MAISARAMLSAAGLLSVLATCSCGKVAGRGATPGQPVAGHLKLRRSVVLEQPDSALIGQFTDLDVGPDGEILLADLMQSNARLYDSTGLLMRVFGRAGDGPGEFRIPRHPRFAADAHILISAAQGVIHEFSSTGVSIRTIRPEGLVFDLGFRVLENGDLLSLGYTGDSFTLVRYDSSGGNPRKLFVRRGVPVADQPDSPRWTGLNLYFFGQMADTAWVVAALSDTLWKVNIRTGETTAAVMSFPGLVRPTLPPASAPAGFDWATAFFRAGPPVAGAGLVAIPFTRGFLFAENEGQAALVWSEPTGWISVKNAPTIIGAAHGDVVARTIDDSGMVRLDFLTPVAGVTPE